jgi:hypothetical protein
VRRLGEFDCAETAISVLVAPDQHDRYVAALASLQRSELLDGC